jgi:hypothetical protein
MLTKLPAHRNAECQSQHEDSEPFDPAPSAYWIRIHACDENGDDRRVDDHPYQPLDVFAGSLQEPRAREAGGDAS